jgi:tetratricopeptide (TPR) repeat protein
MSVEDINAKIRLHLKSAEIKLNLQNYDVAIEELKAAEVLDPENPEVLFNLGIVYARDGLNKTAGEYFEKILNLEAGSVDSQKVRKLYAYSNILINEYDTALKILNECLHLAPGDTEALNMAGFCYEKRKKYDNAISSYLQVIKIEPENFTACNSLAFIMAANGKDLNRALTLAKKAYNSNPENAAYLDTMGYIYLKRNEKSMAKKFIKEAYDRMPFSQEIRTHLNELLGI